MEKWEVIVVGAGPAGLAAACEAGSAGARVLLIDENRQPGGQLFKQIHKFFGSEEHLAGTRGIEIGQLLLQEAKDKGVTICLNTTVTGIFPGLTLEAVAGNRRILLQAQRLVLATGAQENCLAFPGWTLPGVMGAGAAQTMINLHRVLPGRRVLMVGSGNVGLIVSYQLLQAGAQVVGVVEAAPQVGGYGVHAAKLARSGVPIYTGHTIIAAEGEKEVEKAIICPLDNGEPDKAQARKLAVDTICLAVGLTPLAELAWLAGCPATFVGGLGGYIPIHDGEMATPVAGIYVAGDLAGVEEASTAMEEGRLAGTAVAASLGYFDAAQARYQLVRFQERLASLRTGPFGELRSRLKRELIQRGQQHVQKTS